jgi:hypothetical protein
MNRAQPFRIGMRNQFRSACPLAYRPWPSPQGRTRAPYRAAVRLTVGARFWSGPPNQASRLCRLVRRLLRFHESEPLLNVPDN